DRDGDRPRQRRHLGVLGVPGGADHDHHLDDHHLDDRDLDDRNLDDDELDAHDLLDVDLDDRDIDDEHEHHDHVDGAAHVHDVDHEHPDVLLDFDLAPADQHDDRPGGRM